MYSLCCVSKSLNGSDKTDFLVSKVVSDRASKLIGQNGQSFRLSQRRKSSLRRMRASNPSLFGVLKASGTLMSDLNVDSSRCSANILVIEPDICDKEKGAIVTLELSTSREWLLVVKKDGSTKYACKADRDISPSSCNRFTHAIIWTGDDDWKLEFVNGQD
ncbi:hypothetical protein V6N13_137253 [Hibiscus sabdariffa]